MKFYVTPSKIVGEAPRIEVTFASENVKWKDELVLLRDNRNEDAVRGCIYLGHLRRSPSSSSVAVTGCLNKPGDMMEVTMLTPNSKNSMFSVDFYGNTEIIKSSFQDRGKSIFLVLIRLKLTNLNILTFDGIFKLF